MTTNKFSDFCKDMNVTKNKMLSVLNLNKEPIAVQCSLDADDSLYTIDYTLDSVKWDTINIQVSALIGS